MANRNAPVRAISLLLVALLLSIGCSHTASFDTYPRGAMVYIDDKPIGETPIDFTEETGRKYYALRIEKEGYETVERTLKQDRYSVEALAGAGAVGVVGGFGGCLMGSLLGGWLGFPFYGISLASLGGAGYFGYYHGKRLDDNFMYELDPVAEPVAEEK